MRRAPEPHADRRGRVGLLSWILTVLLFLMGFAVLRVLERAPRTLEGERQAELPPPPNAATLQSWKGRTEVTPGVSLRARLIPLFGSAAVDHRARAMQTRFGLPMGTPWRLELELDTDGAGGGLTVRAAHIRNADRSLLSPLSEVAQAGSHADPTFTLLATPGIDLGPEAARAFALWGEIHEDGNLNLSLDLGESRSLGVELEPELLWWSDVDPWFARTVDPDRGSRRTPEVGAAETGAGTVEVAVADPAAEIERLRAELAAERRRRQDRELAWYEYNRALATLDLESLAGFGVDPEVIRDLVEGEPPATVEEGEAPPAPAPDPEAEARRRRGEEIRLKLSTRLRVAGLRGLDLLEVGSVFADEGAGTGPVIFRTLDERGRTTGGLYAERLHLEMSRAARTMTLVLSTGFESHAGERVPFADGDRRIVLPHVEPDAWLDELPELFPDTTLTRLQDDGLWDLPRVRRELNRLLGADGSQGFYRLHSFAGVVGGEFVDVHLQEFDDQGRITRQFFADRMVLAEEAPGILLELTNGAIVTGGEKRAFLDGIHRLYVPRATLDGWRAAELPGLHEPRSAEDG